MKLKLAATLVVLLAGSAASAQQAVDPQTAQIHRGSVKMWIGLGLVGASAILLPITAAKAESGPDGLAMTTGLGLAAAGSCMIWVGCTGTAAGRAAAHNVWRCGRTDKQRAD